MPYVFASNPQRKYYKTTTTTGTTAFNKSESNVMYATTDLGFVATSATVTITAKEAYYTAGSGEDEVEVSYSPKVNVSISTNGSTWTGVGSVDQGENGSVSFTRDFQYLKIENPDKYDYYFWFDSNIAWTKKVTIEGSASDYSYYVDSCDVYTSKLNGADCAVEVS